jgi:hypothetical protein
VEEATMKVGGGEEHDLPPREERPVLTVLQILEWAEAHHAETGRWPTFRSGPIRRAHGFETWEEVNTALAEGLRGLPGGRSLARLLHAYRLLRGSPGEQQAGLPEKYARMLGGEEKGRQPLSVEQILKWADAHYARTGAYPRMHSGPILDAPGESWYRIHTALRSGFRSLPGGMTLKGLLAKHRGLDTRCKHPEETVAKILSWADAFRQAHGRWPSEASGPVEGAPAITWAALGQRLRKGGRGLPGGTTLRRLLVQQRGVPEQDTRPPLSVEQILAWADSYHETHGCWPNPLAGRVAGTGQESWGSIDRVLRQGGRGLPAGSSLGLLLAEHRDARKRLPGRTLTLEQILAWADAQYAATGLWPTTCSGPVVAAPGRDWSTIDHALRKGRPGWPRGLSLARLLGDHGRADCQELTEETILAWADAHHALTGRWPRRHSGPVAAAPGEKWVNIDQALIEGQRGLKAGSSLVKLLASRKAPGGAR